MLCLSGFELYFRWVPPAICPGATNFVLLSALTLSFGDGMPELLEQRHCPRIQEVHFRLTCVVQDRLCLSLLLTVKSLTGKNTARTSTTIFYLQRHEVRCKP